MWNLKAAYSSRIRLARMGFLWLAVLLTGICIRDLHGQTNVSVETVGFGEQVPQIRAKLTAAQEDYNQTLTIRTNLPVGATVAEFIEYRAALQQLVRTYQFQLDDLAALDGTRARIRNLERRMRLWSGLTEPPPYSVLLVDELRNSIQSTVSKIKTVEGALKVDEQFLADAQLAMKARDEKARRIDEQIEAVNSPTLAARLAWLRELESARYRDEVASAAACGIKIKLDHENLAENRQQLAFFQRQLAVVGRQVHFPRLELDKLLDGLDNERQQLEAEIQLASQELASCRQALDGERERLHLVIQNTPAAGTNAAAVQNLRNSVELLGVQEETAVQRLAVLREMLANLGIARQLWQLRFETFDRPQLDDLQRATRRLARLADLIEVAIPFYQQQLSLAASLVTEEQTRLQGQVKGDLHAAQARARLASYQAREEFFLRAAKSLERHQRFVCRWQESIASERASLPFVDRVKDLFSGASNLLTRLWHFEIYVVKDTITTSDGTVVSGRRAVTVGKICLALLIFLGCFWLTNVIARIVESLAISRLKVERSEASLIRRWLRVVLVILLMVFSLSSVNIPLAVFAFAGGALAIGIGFGTQTLMKNFISGIILLLERPFRIGDVLDVQGKQGKVITIGIRSCVVLLMDGTELLIPNSLLLENIVNNWTYSNRSVRSTIKIGVAYDSDAAQVAGVLLKVAEKCEMVQKNPKPQVLFVDFGESALNFELRYWVDLQKYNYLKVGSDLRFNILALLAEHHIRIAYPQRDIHVNTLSPLQVQILPEHKDSVAR